MIGVINAAWAVPFFEKTPSKNTAATGGAIAEAILLMASKILENFPHCVDHAIASSMTPMAAMRPILICFLSDICGFILFTMSTATSVADALSHERCSAHHP